MRHVSNVWSPKGEVLKVDQYISFIFGRLITDMEAFELDALIDDGADLEAEEAPQSTEAL